MRNPTRKEFAENKLKARSEIRQAQLIIYQAQRDLSRLVGEIGGLQQAFARAADYLNKTEKRKTK